MPCSQIGELQKSLRRRNSDHRYMANLFRLYLHVAAYHLLVRMRRLVADPPPASKQRPAEPGELELVPNNEFLEYQRRENQENQPGELQLVLDPEFL